MTSSISTSWVIEPDALTNSMSSPLLLSIQGDNELNCVLLNFFGARMEDDTIGQITIDYLMILFLLFCVSRTDNLATSGIGRKRIFRGTLTLSWIQTALAKLTELGAFTGVNLLRTKEAFVAHLAQIIAALPATPNEFILTGDDFQENLDWLPGHFGPADSQPWHAELAFEHYPLSPGETLLPLGYFCLENIFYFVKAQVLASGGPFKLIGNAYLHQMEDYAAMPRSTMPFELARHAFSNFMKAVFLPKELLIIPIGIAGGLRLLGQRCAMATPSKSVGGSVSAQESILREHFLKLLWQFPLAEKLFQDETFAINISEPCGRQCVCHARAARDLQTSAR